MSDISRLLAQTMSLESHRLSVVAQNIANVRTPGYKRTSMVMAAEFERILNDVEPEPVRQLSSRQYTVFTPGPIAKSERPSDLALSAPDTFFRLSSAAGEVVTRRGDFGVDGQGRLVLGGMPVQGGAGDVVIPGDMAEYEIDSAGRVMLSGRPVAQLDVVRVADTRGLVHLGGGMYDASAADLQPVGEEHLGVAVKVMQGYVEQPNVKLPDEMAEISYAVNHFQSLKQVSSVYGDMLQVTLDTIGRAG